MKVLATLIDIIFGIVGFIFILGLIGLGLFLTGWLASRTRPWK